ncbi:MAG: hypothetical protein ABI759_26175 [Candidatus Solibacter sp.]
MNLPVLDVAIGISFVFLLLALICTTVNEMIAGVFKTRANFLDKGITRLLGGSDELKKLLYKHPLIQSLASSDSAICPSYIPANKFVTAMMDIVSGKGNSSADMAALREGIKTLPSEHLQITLNALLDRAGNNAEAAHLLLEQWFNEGMDRVSGWYKKNSQINAIILAVIVTVVMNADTIRMAALLWTTPTLRAAVVEQAKVRAEKARPEDNLPLVEYPDPTNPTESKPVSVPNDQALTPAEKAQLAQLTGWDSDWKALDDYKKDPNTGKSFGGVIWDHLLGWIITAIAVSMGAPFWFDTLNRFMNIRNAGRAPDEKRDKSSSAPATVIT